MMVRRQLDIYGTHAGNPNFSLSYKERRDDTITTKKAAVKEKKRKTVSNSEQPDFSLL